MCAFPSYPAPIPHPSIFPNKIQKRQNQAGLLTKTSSFISGRSFRGEAKEKKKEWNVVVHSVWEFVLKG
jgi:hypothetical protein